MDFILPAGSGERMQYLAHAFNDNTIRFVLRYLARLDRDALRDAARAVAMSVDVLHASLCIRGNDMHWAVHDALDERDFFSCVDVPGDPAECALKAALESILPEKSRAQLRVVLVRGSDADAIAVIVSHFCVDGGDGRYLLEKLCQAYRMLRETGSAAALEIKNGSRRAEQVYARVTRRQALSLLHNPSTGIKSVFPYPTQEAGERRIVFRTIGARTMAAARARAKEAGATVNDLLLTACYHAFAAAPGTDRNSPVSIMSMLDLRRHCVGGDSTGLSNLSGSLPTALRHGVCASFADTLRDIAVQTAALKADPLAGLMGMPLLHGAVRLFPLPLLLKAAPRVYGMMSVGLTNLGQFRGDALALDGCVPGALYFAGPVKKKTEMQVSAASLDGACALCIAGEYTREDGKALAAFLEHMEAEIHAYAAG